MSDETTEERIRRRLIEEAPPGTLGLGVHRNVVARVMAEEIERLEERIDLLSKRVRRGPARYR